MWGFWCWAGRFRTSALAGSNFGRGRRYQGSAWSVVEVQGVRGSGCSDARTSDLDVAVCEAVGKSYQPWTEE